MSDKLSDLKKKLYFKKYKPLFTKAVKEGKITRFGEEIFTKMSNTIIACLSVPFHIKHADYLIGQGTCYDRSFYMFLALDDAVLVRGNSILLEYCYGKGNGGHGWVEVGDFVYDPSAMLKYDKKTYYSLYGCNNVKKVDKKTYLAENENYLDASLSHDFDEFRPGGKRRLDLEFTVIQIKALCQMIGDEQFTKDFNDYLSFIEYDADQMRGEQQAEMQRLLKDKSAMTIVSGNRSYK